MDYRGAIIISRIIIRPKLVRAYMGIRVLYQYSHILHAKNLLRPQTICGRYELMHVFEGDYHKSTKDARNIGIMWF